MRTILIALGIAIAGLVPVSAAAAAERPVVRGFSFSPAKFVAGAHTKGTKIRFRVSRRSTVGITIARRLAGRLAHHRCVRPSRKVAHRRHCARHVRVGRLVYHRQVRGRHGHAFHGRLRHRALEPGRYRATLVAVDRRHRHSRRRTARFTVVRAPRRSGGGNPAPPAPPSPPSPSAPDGNQFPSPATTGVPAGWTPARTRSSDLDVNTAGAVVQDVRITDGANLNIDAPNVIVRRVELQGGSIHTSDPGVVIEDTTIDRLAPETNDGGGVITDCGYTAVRVAILDRNEGFRESGCHGRPTTIQDSFVRITPPSPCGDWHGDGVQGYMGTNLHVNNVTIDFHETSSCQATSPFFYDGGSGGSPDGHAYINRLLLKGGGYSFRMGTPGSVQGLKIVNDSWRFGPILISDAGCGAISPWEAQIVNADANWRVTGTVRTVRCD